MAKYLCIAKDKYGNILGQDEITASGISDAEIKFNCFSPLSADEIAVLSVYKLERDFDYAEARSYDQTS